MLNSLKNKVKKKAAGAKNIRYPKRADITHAAANKKWRVDGDTVSSNQFLLRYDKTPNAGLLMSSGIHRENFGNIGETWLMYIMN